jgi:hypothetical protein
MSGIGSATDAISIYLSVSKDEQSYVAQNLKADPTLARTVAKFSSDAVTLTTPAAILKNYSDLQVLTGAYNLSGQVNETALLKQIMTQDPDATGSLVQKTANTNYLHLARATQTRTSQTAALGSPSTLSLTTTGATASSLTLSNTTWSQPASKQTSALPGVQWSFVLDDGSASASVAAALNSAVAATDPTASYSVSSAGTVTGSAGAPAVTVSKDSAGNTVYSVALATDKSGNVIQKADVVAVSVAAGTTASARTAQVGALKGALQAAGFDAQLSATNGLSVINPLVNGINSVALSYGTTIATVTSSTVRSNGTLALGAAGLTLAPGNILTDGDSEIGTVASVDSQGNVTLTAAPSTTPAVGSTIAVATGLSFSNLGTSVTTTASSAAGSSTLSLGSEGIGLQPGQIITSGGTAIGTISSVDSSGNVTLFSSLSSAVAAGASLVVEPAVSGASTPALDDQANVSSILKSYETNAYEASMGQQYAGMDDALYYSRTMGSITTIDELMADPTLLNVVTTALGMSSYFGSLSYDQQVQLITKSVNLKTMTSPTSIKQTAEQFLIAEGQANTNTTPTGIASLFSSDGPSEESILADITGVTLTTSTSDTTDPVLSLFA